MSRVSISSVLLAGLAATFLSLPGAAQERQRSNVPDQYKWNLADIYPSTDAWRASVQEVTADIPKLKAFEGKLGSSASGLADALTSLFELDKDLSRVYAYASMTADEDTRNQMSEGMRQQMVQLAASFSAAAAYVEPEILRFEAGKVEKFLAAQPRLAPYRFYLEDIARRAPAWPFTSARSTVRCIQ